MKHSHPRKSPRQGRVPHERCARVRQWTIVAGALLISSLSIPAVAEKLALSLAIAPGDTLRYDADIENDGYMDGLVLTTTEAGNVELIGLGGANDAQRITISFLGFEGSERMDGDLVEVTPAVDGLVVHATVSSRGEVRDAASQRPTSRVSAFMLEEIVAELCPYLPAQVVEPGESWTHRRVRQNAGDPETPVLQDSTVYVLEKVVKRDGVPAAKIIGRGRGGFQLRRPQQAWSLRAEWDVEILVAVQGGHILEAKRRYEFAGTVSGTKVSGIEHTRLKLRKP